MRRRLLSCSTATPSAGVEAELLRQIERAGVGRRQLLKRAGKRFGRRRHVVAGADDLLSASGRGPLLRKIYGGRVRLVRETTDPALFPPPSLPEVAVAGRSNVGKSSLLRALAVKRMRIGTSPRPGTTTSVAFYDVGRALRLVDLPGYGFAYAAEERREAWRAATDLYFRTRPQLRRVLLLLDARHGAKEADRELMARLSEFQVRFQAVLTKADLVPPKELALRAFRVREELRRHPTAAGRVLLVNSLDRAGVADVWDELASLADPGEVERARAALEREVRELAEARVEAERLRREREARYRLKHHGRLPREGTEAAKRLARGDPAPDDPASPSLVLAYAKELASRLASGDGDGGAAADLARPLARASPERRARLTTALFGKAGGAAPGQKRKMGDRRKRRLLAMKHRQRSDARKRATK